MLTNQSQTDQPLKNIEDITSSFVFDIFKSYMGILSNRNTLSVTTQVKDQIEMTVRLVFHLTKDIITPNY
jgi:hypothetical protein